MKKLLNLHFSLTLIVLFTAILAFSLQAKADEYDSYSYQQLQQTSDDSEYAANSNSDEEASHYASHNFDTPSDSAPVVDLSGAGAHPTPQLLRNEDGSNPYAPKQYNSLHTTPPPMPE